METMTVRKNDLLQRAANEARGLAMDAVHAAESGHLGLPLGCAEIGAVLFGDVLQHDPSDPRWMNRDRFILSAGHGSMFLYSWLHIAGYDLPLDELKRFRQLHSRTPGHPEFGATPGVEVTSGPLGQGVGNAVGMAIAAQMAMARFNTEARPLLDYHVIALAGDGCLQEGVCQEASALAGHLGLDNLILIYDSNDVTLDAMASLTQSEDTAARYRAYGFDVTTIVGHDLDAVRRALRRAKANDNGRPKLIIARTEIGRGIPEVAGTAKAHGEGGHKFIAEARRQLGLPPEPFFVSEDVRAGFALHRKGLERRRAAWDETFAAWRQAEPERAALLDAARAGAAPAGLDAAIPAFNPGDKLATRQAAGAALQHAARAMPLLLSGSADLYGSTRNYLEGLGDFSRENRLGRNLRFGIREHAMGAICNGIAYDGWFRASCATFMVFSDYGRPAIRLAAIAGLPVVYFFTHDSVGVGEDGPTHQPVEMVPSLRTMPGLDVIRPADPEETAGALAAALERTDGPTVLALTRQSVPNLSAIPAAGRREGARRGAYVVRREKGALKTILLSCGSELALALAAAEKLGDGARVVSMPCMERFRRQPAAYRDEVLPPSCRRRVAVEAAAPDSWHRWVGLDGAIVAIDRFGLSAPYPQVLQELGITVDAVVEAAGRLA
jgi:transketolase